MDAVSDGGRHDADGVVGRTVRHAPFGIVITDPRLDDNPITYVNDAFQTTTLYSREFALGRNWRFLHGPGTDPGDLRRLAEGLRSEEEFQITFTCHRADGTPFRNHLTVSPVHGADGGLTAFFGLQRIVPDDDGAPPGPDQDGLELLRELQHRVKNHLAMVVSMIRTQARRDVTSESLRAISRRIEALALLYDEMLNAGGAGRSTREIATGAYLSRIASVVTGIQPRAGVRVNVDCEELWLSLDQAARLGLLLSEFLTNSLEHAFEGRESGCVEIRFFRADDGRIRLSVRDDGVGMPAGSDWPSGSASIERQQERAERDQGTLDTTGHGSEPGVGGSIVAALTRSLDGALRVESPGQGTVVTVDFRPGA